MDLKFKCDMFITSFIPLWLSVLIIDVWDVVARVGAMWDKERKICVNIVRCFLDNKLQVISVILLVFMIFMGICGVNSFLKRKQKTEDKQQGKILRAEKERKISSEFLLAYILPMVAFDFSKLKGVVLFLIYIFVLAYLCIRNGNVYTNIYLELKKYKMYNCDIECQILNREKVYYDSLIISKSDLVTKVNKKIPYWDFDNYLYINLE